MLTVQVMELNCALSSQQRHWLTSTTSTFFPLQEFRKCWESNPGLLGRETSMLTIVLCCPPLCRWALAYSIGFGALISVSRERHEQKALEVIQLFIAEPINFNLIFFPSWTGPIFSCRRRCQREKCLLCVQVNFRSLNSLPITLWRNVLAHRAMKWPFSVFFPAIHTCFHVCLTNDLASPNAGTGNLTLVSRVVPTQALLFRTAYYLSYRSSCSNENRALDKQLG